MNSAETKNYILETLRIGDENIAAIHRLLQSEEDSMFFRRMITTHQQQAVELYLKAYILINGKSIQRIHDLEKLMKTSISIGALNFDDLDVSDLNRFGRGVRYADQMDLPEPEDVVRHTALAEEVGRRVKEFVMPRLER